MTRLMLLTVCLMIATTVFAQPPNATIAQYEPLTVLGNGKGEPVPEGTEIRIRWDWDANGPDDKDPLPVVGKATGEASINRFEVNGEELQMGAGTFLSLMPLIIYGNLPDPSTYYLEVCLETHILRSEVFQLESGPQEVTPEEWTVVRETCKELK